MAFDLLVLFIAYEVSIYQLSGWTWMPDYWMAHFLSISVVSLIVFSQCRLYSTMIRSIGTIEILRIILAALLSVGCFMIINRVNGVSVDLGVGSIFGGVVITFTIVSRLIIVELYSLARSGSQSRVLVYGAGESGVRVLQSLRSDDQFRLVALIVDDDEGLCGINVNGLKVQGLSTLDQVIKAKRIEQVHLAIPTVVGAKKNEIIKKLQKHPVAVKILSLPESKRTEDPIDAQFRDLNIEDIISGDLAKSNPYLLEKSVKNKVVMVTGVGTCIGEELSRCLASLFPAHLVLVGISEELLHELEEELIEWGEQAAKKVEFTAVLGAELEKGRLNEIIQAFGVDTIFFAEAYCQVPLLERNIIAAVNRNIFGVLNCVEAAKESGVSNFVLVSTDKAVRPTNIAGVTLRISEQIIQGYAKKFSMPNYCAVRCENILDSNNSVVSLFQRQIRNGGPISITHPEASRRFITARQAAELIIQASSLSTGGDVFVLDIGKPIKIMELIEIIARVMGEKIKTKKFPSGTIELETIGLRAGEKIYEELSTGDNPWGTEHPNILIADEPTPSWELLNSILSKLDEACKTYDCEGVRRILLEADTGFTSNGAVMDSVWGAKRGRKRTRSKDSVMSVLPIEREARLAKVRN